MNIMLIVMSIFSKHISFTIYPSDTGSRCAAILYLYLFNRIIELIEVLIFISFLH